MCVFGCNCSICHPQSDTLATHRQGRVPLRCARARDKTSKQSRPRSYKRGNFLEQQINADPGEEEAPGERGREEGAMEGGGAVEERRRRDNPAAAIVCFPRAGEQGSGESQINLSPSALFFYHLPLRHHRANPQWWE